MPRTPSRLFAAALAVLFASASLFRFLALANGFTNDQFIHLASAQQLLYGEWPTRDFLDPGMPLMYVMSAAAQLVFGRTLFAEAALVSAAFALAAVLTALAVRELTGSALLALAAAALEVAIVPRAYGYPKILTYAAAFFLLQRYVSRPATGRLLALAGSVAIAFLFRHDHGIYLGAGTLVAVVLVPHESGWAAKVRHLAIFGGAIALLLLPYLAYVQLHGGLWAYLQVGLEFRDRELMRAGYILPSLTGDEPLQALLFYEYLLLPVGALLVLVVTRFRAGVDAAGETTWARVLPVVVVALLVDSTIVRPPLVARLPDAIVPGVTLGAWLITQAWHARPHWAWRLATSAAGVIAALSVVVPNHTFNHLAGAGLLRPFWHWPGQVQVTRERLNARHAPQMMPSRAAAALVPFYDYADRCLADTHRLLIVGLIPEAAVFARRAYAGGQVAVFGGYYEDERYQRSIVTRLEREVVPFVLIQGGPDHNDFDATFPTVAKHVRARYLPFATFGDAGSSSGVHVMRDASVPVTGQDAATGWPCVK